MIDGSPLWFTETNAWFVAPTCPGGECILIEAPSEPDKIRARSEHHGLKPVALVNTHGHVYHVGGVGTIVHTRDHNVPVHI